MHDDHYPQYDRLIIDGNNFLYRAYYIPRPEVIVGGVNTTPLHQFLYMLRTAVEQFPAKELFITWDKKITKTIPNFRKSLIAYKEHRVQTSVTLDIWNYCELLRPFTDALGIKYMQPYSLEADDVVHFLVQKPGTSLIISSDKDMYQLVSDNVHCYIPSKKEVLTPNNFEKLTDIDISGFVLQKAIMGDPSDNIPGLEKFGKVRSKKLAMTIIRYYTANPPDNPDGKPFLDTVYHDIIHNNRINQFVHPSQWEIISRNLKITWLNYTHELPELQQEWDSYATQWDQQASLKFDIDTLKQLFTNWEFINFYRDIPQWVKLFDKDYTDNQSLDDMLALIS